MLPQSHRHQQQATGDEQQSEPLEAPEIASAGGGDDDRGRGDDAELLRETEVAQRQADADELGHDGEGVEYEQVDDAEGAPELADALEDEPSVPDAGHGAPAQDHLLVDVEH